MTDRNEIARRAFRTGVADAKNTHMNGFELGPMVEGGGRRPWRVAIAVISQNMVHGDFAMGLAALCNTPGALIALVNQKMEPSSGSPAVAYNNALEVAKALQVDYVFFLGSDVIVPRDALRRLIRHDCDIVGATYLRAMEPYGLIVQPIEDKPVGDSGVHEVLSLPAGCLLVRMAVVEKLKRPQFRAVIIDEDREAGKLPGVAPEYVGFCDAARAAGFKVMCDLDLSKEIGHVGEAVYRLQDVPPPAANETEEAREPVAAQA